MPPVIAKVDGEPDPMLCTAVKAIRTAAKEDLTVESVYSVLRKEEAFKSVTLAQLKKADAVVVSMRETANDGDGENEDEDDSGKGPETSPEHCRLTGDGLRAATVRQPAYFLIQAVDANGKRRHEGGDKFNVSIRGMSQTRARITDNNDGTYLVIWKPHVSGIYSISVALNGTTLPNTPFTCSALPTLPCPQNCVVRGEHLTSAVSRATHHFEVLFKDKLNQVAHAVDLDVYVEPVPQTSARYKHFPKAQDEATKAAAEAEAAAKAKEEEKLKKKKDKKEGKGKGSKSDKDEAATPVKAVVVAAQVVDARIVSAAYGTPDGKSDVQTRYRLMRIRIGQKPLIVRGEYGMESEVIGRLLPGQMVTILEERVTDEGQVRACVSLDSLAMTCDGGVKAKMPVIKDKSAEAPAASTTAAEAAQAARAAARAALKSSRPPTTPSKDKLPLPSRLPSPSLMRGRLETPKPTSAATAEGTQEATAEPEGTQEAITEPEGTQEAILEDVTGPTVEGVPATSAPAAEAASPACDALPPLPPLPPPPPQNSTAGQPAATPSLLDRLKGFASDAAASMAGAGGGLYSKAPAPAPAPTPAAAPAPAAVAEATTVEKKWSVGWVTLAKEGRKLVTSRVKLDPGARRRHMQQWALRKANDRSGAGNKSADGVVIPSTMLKFDASLELKADPLGIGFGFGGVEPGTLHAHGQLHEVHRVSYSIGLAGEYLLHVRLRQQALALPGSPFKLTVRPGAAFAKSTRLPEGTIRGMVGTGSDAGCMRELRTADKMGNMCIVGGALVKLLVEEDDVETEVVDRGDGTYQLRWKSKLSGHFKTHITIDGEDVIGSPTSFSLTSSTPALSNSSLKGDGLKTAVAGKPTTISIKFVDQYSNTALPGKDFQFGMSIGKDKDKLAHAKPHAFEGQWEPGETGIYFLTYKPTQAGTCELHVWCDPNAKGERVPFPGSPFHVAVSPGVASAAVSSVDGFQKQYKEEKNDKYAKQTNHDPNMLYASDTVIIKPQIYDEYSNLTTLAEGALKIIHKLPNGVLSSLAYTTTQKSNLTSYDIRHDTAIAGQHEVEILLDGKPVKGSPVRFSVEPDKAEPTFCKLTAPSQPILYTNVMYICKLKTYDKFNNACKSGGLALSTRLQLMKQGVHDQTALVPSNHSCAWEDDGNGSYSVNITLNIACTLKLFVNMDKNLPQAAGELPPVQLQFIKNPNEGDREENEKPTSAPPAKANAPNAKGKFRAAVQEVMEGFGNSDERAMKDPVFIAAEAFAEKSGGKKATDSRGSSSGKAFNSSGIATSSVGSTGSATGPATPDVKPNPNLFDKEAGAASTPLKKATRSNTQDSLSFKKKVE